MKKQYREIGAVYPPPMHKRRQTDFSQNFATELTTSKEKVPVTEPKAKLKVNLLDKLKPKWLTKEVQTDSAQVKANEAKLSLTSKLIASDERTATSELTASTKAKIKRPLIEALLQLFVKLTTISLIVIAVFSFVFGINRVNDLGMLPNIAPGDMLLYYRLARDYKVGEVVAINYKGQVRALRIVALPKDKVSLDEHGFQVNGANQFEPKIYKETKALEAGIQFPVVLKDDEYFILGDNRDKTTDSRIFGPIKLREIKGRVFSVIRNRGI